MVVGVVWVCTCMSVSVGGGILGGGVVGGGCTCMCGWGGRGYIRVCCGNGWVCEREREERERLHAFVGVFILAV